MTYVCMYTLQLGYIIVLLLKILLKCHDNQNQRDIFSIIVSIT